MSVRISFIKRKSLRERVWKTLNVVVGITTILNVSMVGSLIAPHAAGATVVSVQKSDSVDPIVLNSTTTYTLKVTNDTTQNKTLTVTDTLPAQFEYVTGSASVVPATVSADLHTVTWSITVAKNGGTKSISYDAKGTVAGTWRNNVAVTASGVNVSDYEDTTVNTPPAQPVANPKLGQSCGLDIGLLVDTSGSVSSSEMTQMKTALSNFATAFAGTPTVFSLSSFNTNSTLNQAFSRTPAQIAADITANIPNSGDGNTNWDSGLQRSFATFDPRLAKSNLIVIATDGSPNRWGYPTADGTFDWNLGLANAIPTANAIKTAGTRIVVLGIGEDDTDPATPAQKLDKMKAISGSIVATTPGTITPDTDVIKVSDFSGIGDAVAAYAKALCGGKILVQKQFDTNGDGKADVTPDNVTPNDSTLAGWSFDVNGTPSNPDAQVTPHNGSVEFNVVNGTYSVLETLKAGTHMVSAICKNGNQTVGTVDLNTGTISGLVMGTDDTISCTVLNGYTSGSLKVTKVVTGGSAKPEQFGFRLAASGPYTYPAVDQNYVVFNDLTAGSQVSVNETVGNLPYHQTGNTCQNVTIVAGQQATCTVTNARDTGRVTFQKVVNNEPNANVAPFTFTVNGHDYHSGDAATFDTGTYGLTENSVANYHFVDVSGICSKNDKGEISVNVTSNGGTCTIINARNTGSLKVNKLVDQANGQGFVAVSGAATPFRWQLNAGSDRLMGATATDLPTGSNYNVTENSVPNYHFVGWYDNSQTDKSCANPQATSWPTNLTVGYNATTEITLCNARDTGTITVHKLLDTNNDGKVDATDPAGWFYGITGGPSHIAMGSSVTIPTGTITVAEEQQANYHNVSWICYAGQTQVAAGTGEALTTPLTASGVECWFTNARDTGRLTILKNVDVNGNGSFNDSVDIIGSTDWTWNIAGGASNIATGDSQFLATGQYSVTENQQSNYHFVKFTCGDAVINTNNGAATVTVPTSGLTCTYWNARNTGTIEGVKWNDHNGNGVRDAGDEGLAGWTFQTSHGLQATSDANGFFQITNVPTGSETVTELPVAGWVNTNHNYVATVNVEMDKTTNVDFGNFAKTSITGSKFNDLNGNGTWDQGEPTLAQWTIALLAYDQDSSSFVQVATTTTNASGQYTFNDLGPGTYRVREMQQTGWSQTSAMPNDVSPLLSGTPVTDLNFGNFKLGKISGYKFEDSTEGKTLPGWEICLSGGNQEGDRCTSTNEEGYYEFTDVATGTYSLYEFGQLGWHAVAPASGRYDDIVFTSGSDISKNFVNSKNVFTVDITKTGLETVAAGANLTYTLHWTITGNTLVHDLTITDPIGSNANMSFDSMTCGTTVGSCTMSYVAGLATWSLGDRMPNDSGTVTVTVKVTAPLTNGTQLNNTGTICGRGDIMRDNVEQEGLPQLCDDGSTTTRVTAAPTIDLTKTAAATVTAGQNIVYTLTWSVSGNAPATNAVITDSTPANTTFVSASCGTTSGTCVMNAVAGTVSWNLGTRLPGDTGTVTMTVKSASPIANGTVVTNTGNFDTTETAPVVKEAKTTILSAPSLSITKSNDVIGFTNPGKQVTYTVVVTNAIGATDTAHAVVLTDVLPAGFTYTVGGGSTKNFVLGEIAPGASVVTTYTATIATSEAAGTYTNTATASGSNATPVSATSTVEVRVPSILGVTNEPTMVVTKTVDTKSTNPGKTITYTVTISNPGEVDLTDVKVDDTLPKGFTFADTGKATKTWAIGTLKAHHQRVINYLVKVGTGVKAGDFNNVVVVLSNELDPQKANVLVNIKVPQVLGLATTGPSAQDYLAFSLGISLLSLGVFWAMRLRRQANGSDIA